MYNIKFKTKMPPLHLLYHITEKKSDYLAMFFGLAIQTFSNTLQNRRPYQILKTARGRRLFCSNLRKYFFDFLIFFLNFTLVNGIKK